MMCHTRRKSGFTFLELLLAVAVSGLILMAATQLMFTFVHFWQQSELEPRFNRHVDGVATFLQYCIDESVPLTPNGIRRFGWDKPPGERQPAMHFRLAEGHPFFVTETRPSPQVDAWLVFDEERGLSMLWHIPVSLTEGKPKLYRTPVSPWVEEVEVAYFDSSRNLWEYEPYAEEGRGSRRSPPGAVRIIFNQNGRTETRNLRILRHDRNVLIY